MTPETLAAYLQEFLRSVQKVGNPKDEILSIFDKITEWKRQAGNLDDQEKMVARKLKNSEGNRVEIHNVKTLKAKLAEFQQEIGLSEDEVIIIMYTSLDLDWFNNLLVLAGEFLKWFNLNFEGESREELDFQESKMEYWTACVAYA